MKNHAQELFLLTTTLSQLNNKDRIIRLFIESMNDIFQSCSFEWFKEKSSDHDDLIEVCTRHKNYGFIAVKTNSRTNTATNKLIYNATQLLAIFLEKIEQEVLLLDQKNHLQILVDKQTAELNRTNLSLEKELAVRCYTEEQLEARNTLLSTIINSPNDIIIFSLDRKYCYTAFNEQHRMEMKKVWNVEIKQGVSLLECISDSRLKESARYSMDRALRGEEFSEVQFQPGPDIYYEFRWSPIFQHEEIIGLTAFISDITERKRTEKELKESEEKYRSLVQKIQAAVVVHGADTRILICNSEAQKLLGLSEEQLLGKTAIDPDWHFFREDGSCMPLEEYPANKVISTRQELRDYIVGIHHLSGNDVYALVNAQPIFNESNEIIEVAVTFIDITEQRKANLLLKEKQNLLLEAQQIAHIGNWWHNLQTDEIFWSDEFFRIIGRKPQEPDIQLSVDIIHPEDLHIFQRATEESAAGKMEHEHEFRIIRPDGEIRWIHNRWLRVNDKNGKEIRRIGTHQDVTERRLAEEALKESEWRYREIFDNVLDNLYLLEVTDDGHFRNLEMNPAFEKSTGISRSQLIGKTIEETVPAEVAAIVNAKYRHCVEAGHPIEEEAILDLPSGKRYFHSSLIPARDEKGKIHRIIGISRDITERKESEQKLKLLNFALNNVHDEAYLIDEHGYFSYVNDEACRTLGYSKDVLLTMNVSYIDPDFPFERWSDHWKEIQKKRSLVFESRHKTKKGLIYPIEISVNYFEYNNKGYNLALARNITDRKQAEKKIQELNHELEQRVLERTFQLESANKELEAFAYSVSHDLRAPLRAIDGFSRILLQEFHKMLDDNGKNYLERVLSATKRMGQLIDDLLKLSKVTRSEMNRMEVDLSFISNQIANDIQNSETDRKVKFIIQENIIVNGDERLLRIVMENLLGNAWKFTSKHLAACIEFGMIQHKKKDVCFVRDNGVGFEMKYAQKLFGAFQRLHSAQDFSGTGIGLATVQRIIHRHGGEVWAEGEVEKGATFYFTL